MENLPEIRNEMIIEQLKEEIKSLQAQLNVLKALSQPTIKMQISSEEMICIEQLEVLRNRSSQRELSLDDVKRLDILIKNLRLIRNESTEVINTTNYNTVNEDDLVAIATSRPESPN